VAPARLLASAEPSPGEARKLGIALALAQELRAALVASGVTVEAFV